MKATLTFNLPEDQSEFDVAVKGRNAHSALSDVRQDIFRPARKHGYSSPLLAQLLESINTLIEGTADHSAWPKDGYGNLAMAEDIIHLLEEKFNEILDTNGVSEET